MSITQLTQNIYHIGQNLFPHKLLNPRRLETGRIKTYTVDCQATSPTPEQDSLISQGRRWPRGPTWRLGISSGNVKVANHYLTQHFGQT